MLDVAIAIALVFVFAFFANRFHNELVAGLEREFPSKARAWEQIGRKRP